MGPSRLRLQSDGYAWSEWYTINITTGANNLATYIINHIGHNLNQWYLIDLITVNDADGDGSKYSYWRRRLWSGDVYSVSQRGFLDGSNGLHDTSLSDLFGAAFVEAQFMNSTMVSRGALLRT